MPAGSAVSCVLGKSPMLTFLAQRQSLAVIYRRGTKIQASNLAVRLKRKDSATTDLDDLSASTTEKSSDMLSVTKVTGTRLGTAAGDISLQSYRQQSALASRPFRRPGYHSALPPSVPNSQRTRPFRKGR